MNNQNPDVVGFLKEHSIKYEHSTKTEIIVTPCPVCGTSKKKFYINQNTGLYDCKICQARGNFFKFKTLYGVVENISSLNDENKDAKPLPWETVDKLVNQLQENEKALEYLKGRGFTEETILHFQLGYKKDDKGEWIAIPHISGNELWNVKYRRFAGGEKTFRRVTGQPTMLFNIDGVDYNKDTVYVTEAETDAVAVWQMGIKNVVSLTAGAGTFKPEWKEFFSKFNKVYLIMDSDDEGQKGARKVAEIIGLKKVKNVILPVKDANEYMQKHTSEDFVLELSKATKFEMKNVSTLEDVMHDWDDWFKGEDKAIQGIATGFRELDMTTSGFKNGDLIIVSGNSGIGKTTLVNTWVNHIIRSGHPVLGFYLEGQVNYMIARMIGAHYNLKYKEIPTDPELYKKIKEETSDLPLHYYSGPQGGMDLGFLKEYIPAVVDLYGIKLIVIDNLQKVVRGSDSMYNQRVSETVSVIKDLAVDLKIPILLIAHPKKTDPRISSLVTMYDAKSSSTIYQDADQYWILQKTKDGRFLTIEKNRMGEDGVTIDLDVDMEKAVFREHEREPNSEPGAAPKEEPLQENF